MIVDDKNVVWRWRPADANGHGTTTIGPGHRLGRLGRRRRRDRDVPAATRAPGLYNLYVVDPSEQNILAYSPASDGSGFHVGRAAAAAVARDVSKVTDLLIDGDIFVADGGTIVRFVGGKSEGWTIQAPGTTGFAPQGDILLRSAPDYTLIASADATSGRACSTPGTGPTPGSSRSTRRRARSSSSTASPAAARRSADVRGMYVVPGAAPDAPATLVWATKDAVMSAVLEARAGPASAPGAVRLAGPDSRRPVGRRGRRRRRPRPRRRAAP